MTRVLQSATPKYISEAFECDNNFNQVTSKGPKRADDSVRICVRPTRFTSERGVVMRSIDSFTFIKTDGTFQEAIVPNGRETQDTLLTCEPGDKVCVFTTKLNDAFFTSNGDVTGIGEAHLEFLPTESNGDLRHLRRRRAQYTDLQFAGTWEVEMSLQVIRSEPKKKGGALAPNVVLDDVNPGLRFVMVAVVIIATLLSLCCIVYWSFFVYKQKQDNDKFVDGNFPGVIDIDSQASHFENFPIDLQSTKSESEGEPEDSFVDEWNDHPMEKCGGLCNVPESTEENDGPPGTINVQKVPSKASAWEEDYVENEPFKAELSPPPKTKGTRNNADKEVRYNKKKEGSTDDEEEVEESPDPTVASVKAQPLRRKKSNMDKSQAPSVASSVYSTDEVESFQNDQSQDSTAESTETTSESLDRHKSVSSDDLSISDTDDDSVNFYPDEDDIAFDTPGHAGTVVYEMAVRQAASSHDGAPFSTRIFKEIEKQVDGKSYYLKEVTGRFEFWREATPEEAKQHFRKSYKRELAAIE
jgi:hypothetical protein